MSELQVAQSSTVEVNPAEFNVPTGVCVQVGQQYSFSVSGKWKDWFFVCDHLGWGHGLITRLSRVPGEPFFRLCGSVGKDDRAAFAIDTTRPWTVPVRTSAADDSQLYLFANDIRLMYWNNCALDKAQGGPMLVTISRLR